MASTPVIFLSLLVIFLMAVAQTACQSAKPTTLPSQGIEGRYLLSGLEVIQDCDQFPSGPQREECETSNKPWTRPLINASIEIRDRNNEIVTKVVTDSQGTFRVPSEEGEYLLCADSCQGPITVVSGGFTKYDLIIAAP